MKKPGPGGKARDTGKGRTARIVADGGGAEAAPRHQGRDQ
jgi:hypothetical protein